MRRPVDTEPEAPPINLNFDTINEQIILATALAHPNVRHGLVRRFREYVPFTDKLHAKLWGAVVAMDGRKLEFDPATVQTYTDTECAEYAAELVDARPDIPPNLEHHIHELEWSIRRFNAVNGPMAELINHLRDPLTPKEHVIEASKRLAIMLVRSEDTGTAYDTQAVINEQCRDLADRRDGRAVYPYGIEGLDVDEEGNHRLIPGAAPKKITLVTGVSGSGKSTIAARMALAQIYAKRRLCIGAWEMNAGITIEILATMHLGLSRTAVTTGDYTVLELAAIRSAMEELKPFVKFIKLPAFEPGQGKRSNIRQVDAMMDAAEEHGAEIFLIDLLRKGFISHNPEEEELALNHMQHRVDSSQLHAMFVQQQRMKDVEMRQDKRPTREGVKGTSAWVEISDTVLGIHRDAQWKNIEDRTLEIDILKQRFGVWPLAVRFDWDPIYATISNGRSTPYDLALSSEGGMGGGVAQMFGKGRKRR